MERGRRFGFGFRWLNHGKKETEAMDSRWSKLGVRKRVKRCRLSMIRSALDYNSIVYLRAFSNKTYVFGHDCRRRYTAVRAQYHWRSFVWPTRCAIQLGAAESAEFVAASREQRAEGTEPAGTSPGCGSKTLLRFAIWINLEIRLQDHCAWQA